MNSRKSIVVLLACVWLATASARAYVLATTVPRTEGCPTPDYWIASAAQPLALGWSTVLPGSNVLVTTAAQGTPAQTAEIQAVIEASIGAWTGVEGTTVNSVTYPGAVAASVGTTATQDACLNDQESNADGVNTICFDQSSDGFTTGVLTFTRTIVATAPGVAIGSAAASIFTGQILQAGILVRNDGSVSFATPSALASSPGAYDLQSILVHEMGHVFGLQESGIWRAAMFPIAASPDTFSGDRPTALAPDAPLADDDRTGLRVLYHDPNDAVYVGELGGKVLPANPFALASQSPTSAGESVTGIFGTEVVAVNAASGAVVAGTLGGWSCNPVNSIPSFDGTYEIDRLPLGQSYELYVEPFDGLATASNVQGSINDLCESGGSATCMPPAVDLNFTARIKPQ